MNASGSMLAATALPMSQSREANDADYYQDQSFLGEFVEMPPQPDPISAGLKKLFETVAEEPIPDDFLSLLDQIDAERSARQSGASPDAVKVSAGAKAQ